MKTARLVLPILVLAACCAPPAPTRNTPLCDVVRLQCGENGEGAASAVPISPTWLLTAKHTLPIVMVGDQPPAEIIEHPDQDLLLVRVAEPRDWRCAPLATEQPGLGDRLVAGGYNLGDFLLWTDGRQGGAAKDMSCPIIFGASGGPVLNARGELVGIIAAVVQLSFPFGIDIPVPHCSQQVPVVGLHSWILSYLNL